MALVEHYRGLPDKMRTQMVSGLDEYRKKLQEVSQKIEKEENSAEVVKEIEKATNPIFSSIQKRYFYSNLKCQHEFQ